MGPKIVNQEKPAFYARKGSRLADYWTLLHPPYTAWNMAYVAMGAALAPTFDWFRLAIILPAFFVGTGIVSHALDELNGRPLKTSFSDHELKVMAIIGIIVSVALAGLGALIISPWLLLIAAIGILLVAAYTLEWWGGLIHTDLGFALSWGAFPVLTGYWTQAETLAPAPLFMAGAAILLSLAQRGLSTPARHVRRRTYQVKTVIETENGQESWDKHQLLTTWELPLKLLAWTTVLLAISLVTWRLEMFF